jgi:CHASE2 domain-containing sensor protein
VLWWFRRDGSSSRPPLAYRLVGLAVGMGLLSITTLFALHVLEVLIPVVVPLLGLLFVYVVMFGRHRHK